MEIAFYVLLTIYVYIFSMIRLLSRELKGFVLFLRTRAVNKVIASIIVGLIFILSPVILGIYIVTTILWKIVNFIMK